MAPEEMEAKLKEKFGDAILSSKIGKNGLELQIEPSKIAEVCRYLKETPEFDFHFLRCLSAVDWIQENQLEVVYHLYSFRHYNYQNPKDPNSWQHELVLKVRVPRDNPRVPSVANIWRTADWQEREAYDLMGIIFEGHPDLRRILMPAHWEGHPLRKDYVYDVEKFDVEYAERIKRGEIL